MTTYIKLEDVQKEIENALLLEISESERPSNARQSPHWIIMWLLSNINSLQTINPELMIEEMLKECKEMRFSWEYKIWMIDALRELLQKFKS